MGLMSEAALEAIVREKEAKAAEYNPCGAYWLLVVVDWIDPAQEQEIRIDDRPWSLRTCLKKSSSTSPISSTSLKSSDARRRPARTGEPSANAMIVTLTRRYQI